MGLHFPRERWRELERGISSAAQEFDFQDAESCIKWLLSSSLTKNQIEILASHLTVGETYFFREMNSLEVLADRILPELIRSRREDDRHLRIWSVGCSTGEEPYSVAMLLDKILPDINNWSITITATDINSRSLQKASEGVYGEWAFRCTSPWIQQKYFEEKKGNRFEISHRIKGLVTFSYLNLATDPYPSLLNNTNAMDLILCRNVLMYFTPEQVSKVIRQLNLSLVDGGWLIVSAVDASPALSSRFVPINFLRATLYRRDGKQPLTVEAPPLRLDPEPEVLPPLPSISHAALESVVSPPEIGQDLLLEVEVQHSSYEEALALYGQGYYREVADRVLGLVSRNNEDSNALALLARAYANQGKLGEALAWCEKAVATDKWHPGLHCLLANILQEQGQIGKAVASLKRALYLDPNFVLAHFALGNLTRQQGKAKESEKHFQNALSLLRTFDQEEILPESEGLTAGRLIEIINAMSCRNTFA